MKRGQRIRRSEAEEKRRARFREFLEKEQNIQKPKTRDDYVSAVGRALTDMLQPLLNGESLYTIEDPEQISKVAEWWEEQQKGLQSLHRTAMRHYLQFLNVDLKPPAPVSKHVLQIPPYKLRLADLVKSFFYDQKRHSMELDIGIYSQLLHIFSGEPAELIAVDSLRERTDSFKRLRWNILQRIEHSPEKIAADIEKNFSNILRTSCQTVITDIMRNRALDILKDLEENQVPYENSLLPCLAQLQAACWKNDPHLCAQAMLPLFRTVLLDCDPASRSYPPGQAALKDERSWEAGVLWAWIDGHDLSGEEITFFLSAPFPQKTENRSHLAAALFHGMLRLGTEPSEKQGDWTQADRWMETAAAFCGQYWQELCPTLLHPPAPRFPKVPESLLLGGVNASIYYAQLRQRQTKLLLHMPEAQETEQIIRLIRAQNALWKSSAVLRKRIEDDHELVEALTKTVCLWSLLAENTFYEAECCRRFALLEKNEACLTDVLEMYIRPCREILVKAVRLFRVSQNKPEGLYPKAVCQTCFDTFFDSKSPFVRRLRLQPGTDDRGYHEEQRLWEKTFSLQYIRPAAVHLPLDPDQLRDGERFKPVYCGVFDSVLGKNPAQQRPSELTLFQLLGSSQTSILQMNQVVDNLAMLQLFHVPGYQAACRAGFVTLSCYGEIHSPKAYLEKNLLNPNFVFSCSQAFQLPPDLTAEEREKAIREGARGVMLRYLNGQASLKNFPSSCDRGEMEFLAESWKIAFECFQHSDLRRFHQNPAYRFPPSSRKPPYAPGAIAQVVQERLDLLIQEARQPGSSKNLERLLDMEARFRKVGTQPDRSKYDIALDMLKQEDPDPIWEDLRTVIHQCYFLSNGSLCCDHILLTASDSDFILSPSSALSAQVSYMDSAPSATTEYIYRQSWKPGTLENIGWPDLCDIALISRELDLKSGGQSLESRLAQKERETGLGYFSQKDQLLLMDYIARLSTDERVHVCPAEEQKDAHYMEMNTKEM